MVMRLLPPARCSSRPGSLYQQLSDLDLRSQSTGKTRVPVDGRLGGSVAVIEAGCMSYRRRYGVGVVAGKWCVRCR